MKYNFHGNFDNKNKTLFAKTNDHDAKLICKYFNLDISVLDSIKYNVYDSREGKYRADPLQSISRASARFSDMSIYRYWDYENEEPSYPHEITHLIAHKLGNPYEFKVELDTYDDREIITTIPMVSTSFLQEGLAVAIDDLVFKRKIFEGGRWEYLDLLIDEVDFDVVCLDKVINLDGFCSYENAVVIPFAANFARNLLVSYGIEKFIKAYTSVRETYSPSNNIKILEKIYGNVIYEACKFL